VVLRKQLAPSKNVSWCGQDAANKFWAGSVLIQPAAWRRHRWYHVRYLLTGEEMRYLLGCPVGTSRHARSWPPDTLAELMAQRQAASRKLAAPQAPLGGARAALRMVTCTPSNLPLTGLLPAAASISHADLKSALVFSTSLPGCLQQTEKHGRAFWLKLRSCWCRVCLAGRLPLEPLLSRRMGG
jgi:hypothetical protein